MMISADADSNLDKRGRVQRSAARSTDSTSSTRCGAFRLMANVVDDRLHLSQTMCQVRARRGEPTSERRKGHTCPRLQEN